MAKLRVQMARTPTNNLARDRIINTFYLDTDRLDVVSGVNYDQLATDAATAFGNRLGGRAGFNGFEAVIYNMGDASPRQPRAVKKFTQSVPQIVMGPREVSLCLSFYGERNVPSRRGRLYLGPFNQSDLTERPSLDLRTSLGFLAQDIGNLGGVDIDWVVYSPKLNTYAKVTNWWIDDEWDTQRQRGLKATHRVSGVTSE